MYVQITNKLQLHSMKAWYVLLMGPKTPRKAFVGKSNDKSRLFATTSIGFPLRRASFTTFLNSLATSNMRKSFDASRTNIDP